MSLNNIFTQRAQERNQTTKPQNIFSERAQQIQQKKEEIPDFFEEGFGPEFERETERHQARNMSRFLESTVGLPGDIASFVTGLFGKEQNVLPTSKKLQEFSEKVTKGFTAPRNELEKFGDDIFKDIGGMLFPGATQYNAARNIGIPIVGNLIKEGIHYAGADEKNAAYTKMGTMIVLDLLSQRSGMGGGAKQYASNLYNKAEELIPEGAKADAKNLQKHLSKLKESFEMGGERPSTVKALKKISEVENDIKDGQIGMKNLLAYRRSINEVIEELGGYNVELPAKVRQRAVNNLQDVKKATIEASNDWGKNHSPQFLKLNKSANEAWAAIENSNKVTKFIQKHAGKYANPLTKTLFGITPVAGGAQAVLAPPTLAATGALSAGYNAYKILSRAKNSKALQKYYANIIKGALAGNASQVSSNMIALNKGMQEAENQSSQEEDS